MILAIQLQAARQSLAHVLSAEVLSCQTSLLLSSCLPACAELTVGGGDQMDAQKAVEEAIVGVFSLHGAVPMASNTVGACPADPPRNAAVLLTSDGARLALRYDLRTPFAAWLSRRSWLKTSSSLECSCDMPMLFSYQGL